MTLTTSVAQLHSDFLQVIDNIRSVGKGILNLENRKRLFLSFESLDACYKYSTVIDLVDNFSNVQDRCGYFRFLLLVFLNFRCGRLQQNNGSGRLDKKFSKEVQSFGGIIGAASFKSIHGDDEFRRLQNEQK